MNKILKILIILVKTTFATQTLAVLEIIPAVEDIEITYAEYRHMTDELRRQAVQTLPSGSYAVLTRDNMFSLLPPDEEEAMCLAESCAIDIGRAIGAEFISQGKIDKFGGDFSLSIELYETMGGKLIGSIVMESKDVKGLIDAIRKQAPGLFSKIKFSGQSTSRFSLTAIQKSNTFYIALGLDILGVAALGFGVYQHFNANGLYDDYKKMQWLPSEQHGQYKDAHKKATDAKTLRNIGLAVGGGLLVSGIAVHIFF